MQEWMSELYMNLADLVDKISRLFLHNICQDTQK